MAEELEVGTKLHARFAADGAFYPAEVVAISTSTKRMKAPVKVRFVGYGPENDCWMALADLQSKRLTKAKSAAKANETRKSSLKPPRNGSKMAFDDLSPTKAVRMKRSESLETEEDLNVELATANFERVTSHAIEVPGHFADRERWASYQELLAQTKETVRAMGKNTGELETETDRAMTRYSRVALRMLNVLKRHAAEPKLEAFLEHTFVTPALKGCVFVGHVATDMDSIAGAIGAAELFEGIAAKSEVELNGEIKYVLQEVCHLEEPPLFDDLPGCGKPDENGAWKKICLVDHNEEKQMVKSLREDKNRKKRIVGVIDHHALSESFSSETPLLIDIRPWGCMSSIVAHLHVRSNAKMRPEIARLLMCAILSDTLNLQSVTTTDADRFAVTLLAKLGGVEDPDQVARQMFRHKTKWIVGLGPYAMVRGDQKDFTADGWKYGIAVLEVTDLAPVLDRSADLIVELRALKIEKGGIGESYMQANELDFAFLFVVDVVKQMSVLLICGGRERELAKRAFPGCAFRRATPTLEAPGQTISADETLCDVGPLVSRKAQFVPAFAKVLNAGFKCHKERVSSPEYVDAPDDNMLRESLHADKKHIIIDDHQEFTREFGSLEDAKNAIFRRHTTL